MSNKVLHVMPSAGHASHISFIRQFAGYLSEKQAVLSKMHQIVVEVSGNGAESLNALNSFGQLKQVGGVLEFLALIYRSRRSFVVFHQKPGFWIMMFAAIACRMHYIQSGWIVWGGDLYNVRGRRSLSREMRPLLKLRELLKLSVDSYFATQLSTVYTVPGDERVFRETYPSSSSVQTKRFFYPFNTMLNETAPIRESNFIAKKILISHSAAEHLKHTEIISMLSHHAASDFEIYAVLSYSGTESYINEVVSEGQRVFGARFHPVMDYMTTSDYAAFLNTMDIAVFITERQAGVQNIFGLISSGVKIFANRNITPMSWLIENGIHISESASISSLSSTEFLALVPDEIRTSRAKLHDLLSDRNMERNFRLNFDSVA